MTEKQASEIMKKTIIQGVPYVNTLEYMEALETSIDVLGTNYTREQLKNWILVNKYPFLLPKYWNAESMTYEVDKDYDYTWTELDAMPMGWRKAFGEIMCEEIKEELIKHNCLDEYLILDIKEKFGQLRWYDNGTPIGCNVSQIIDKYSVLSENICFICGKPDVPMTGTLPSYILPFCKTCYCTPIDYVKGDMTDAELKQFRDDHERDWEEWFKIDNKMRDKYSVRRWVKDKDDYEEVTYDIFETANKIRAKWRAEHGE